jgi:hypothetical protein
VTVPLDYSRLFENIHTNPSYQSRIHTRPEALTLFNHKNSCRREVKNDKAEKAQEMKLKREEMEKLAVAPGSGGAGSSGEPGVGRDSTGVVSKTDTSGATNDTGGTANDGATNPKTSPLRSALFNASSRDTSSIDACVTTKASSTTQTRKTRVASTRRGSVFSVQYPAARRGSTKYCLDAEDKAVNNFQSRAKTQTASGRTKPDVVETKSIWVGPGHFVQMNVERPPARMEASRAGVRGKRRSSPFGVARVRHGKSKSVSRRRSSTNTCVVP